MNFTNAIQLRRAFTFITTRVYPREFELKSARKEDEVLYIDLEEMNSIPAIFEDDKLESKGFFPTVTVQDFPIRGHQVFFPIKWPDG